MKGSLHTEDLDNIMQCMANPTEVVSSIEGALAVYAKDPIEMNDIMMSLSSLGSSLSHLV